MKPVGSEPNETEFIPLWEIIQSGDRSDDAYERLQELVNELPAKLREQGAWYLDAFVVSKNV